MYGAIPVATGECPSGIKRSNACKSQVFRANIPQFATFDQARRITKGLTIFDKPFSRLLALL